MANFRAKSESAKQSYNRQGQSPEPDSHEKLDANNAMLRNIKGIMDDMKAEIILKFESTVTEAVRIEVTATLRKLLHSWLSYQLKQSL